MIFTPGSIPLSLAETARTGKPAIRTELKALQLLKNLLIAVTSKGLEMTPTFNQVSRNLNAPGFNSA
jgi:hypothetical protein